MIEPLWVRRSPVALFRQFGASWVGMALWMYVVQASALGTGPIIGRALGADGRGFLALSMIVDEVTSRICNFGVPLAVGFLETDTGRERSRVLGAANRFALLASIPSLVVGIALYAIARAYGQPLLPALLLGGFAALSPLGSIAGSHRQILLARGDLVGGRTYYVIPQLATVAVVVVGELLGHLTLAVAMSAVLLTTLVQAILMRRRTGVRGAPGGPLRPLLAYGVRAVPGSLGEFASFRVDQIVVGTLLGLHVLGIYAVAVAISNVPLQATNALGSWAYGFVRGRAGAATAVSEVASKAWVVGIGLVGAMLVVAPLAVLLYGREYSDALMIVFILLVGTFCLGLANVLSQCLQAEGRPGTASMAQAIAVVSGIVFLPILTATYGVVGAAVGSSAMYALRLIWLLFAYRRRDISVGAAFAAASAWSRLVSWLPASALASRGSTQ